jgi:hypothetical protein
MARVRSPNYPALSLPEAIKLVTTVQAAEQHLAAPKEVVAKHLGYSSYHGKAGRVVAALENYGLLEEVSGDKVKVSDLAMSILFPATPEEKQAALNTAAYKHPLFSSIKEEWHGSRPSDENLRVYLIRRKFGADALDRVIEVYKETMDLVTPESGVYPVLGSDPKGQQETPKMQPNQHQTPSARPPAAGAMPLSSGEPFRLSISGNRLQGAFELTNLADAEDMIRAINAWKTLLKPADDVK